MEQLQCDRESGWLRFRCTACDCMQLCPPLLKAKWLKTDANSDALIADDLQHSEDEVDHRGSDSELEREGVRKQPGAIKQCQSETFNGRYVCTEEVRIVVGTWNVAGRVPPPHLKLHDWMEMNDPADIYVLGFQEIVALDAWNVLCAEDTGPAIKWQAIIHEALNGVNQSGYDSFGACPSPSREQICEVSGTVIEDAESLVVNEANQSEYNSFDACPSPSREQISKVSGTVVGDTECLVINDVKLSLSTPVRMATKVEANSREAYKGTECIGIRSLRIKSGSSDLAEDRGSTDEDVLVRPLLSPISRADPPIKNLAKHHVRYVCVASKQMVGIYITVWVRRKLRRFIRSLTVSHVGLGLMGCLGNKGSVSVSMMLYQTNLCFICSHLASGNKEGDEFRRNEDVMGTLKRTYFSSSKAVDAEIPRTIYGHDCIIWLGDLNYRINLPDSVIRFLIAREDWPALLGKDQLRRQFLEGRVFEGWHEGTISFAPTYKYDIDSDHYVGESVTARHSPAWCDRIVWYGKGLKQLSYRRQESILSDHKPVNAVFLAGVDVFSECKG